ncbi:unnamed protein product [Adineta ricciae]|uniref:Ig-like domain-containing protein n=1 Tax=Adineta ricciae TaxID=249248 RepID=A0A813ZEG3_ADIRI|nr:unnamed protein product [Adineta ricciae]
MINCSTTPTTCQLNLVNIHRWDNGIYECIAMNSVGTIGRFYEVDVQFPPYVHSSREEVRHSVGDAVVIECMVDANPEPDIRWLHRYSNETKQEIDLSRQYSQEKLDKKREDRIWFIKHEQLNATRWKTSLFIQRIPKRLFNSNFICRAINRYGQGEQIITMLESHHFTKKHRHTSTTSVYSSSLSSVSTTTDEFLSEKLDEMANRSTRHSFTIFIFGCSAFLSCLYKQ